MHRLALPLLLIAVLPLRAAAQSASDSSRFHASPAIGVHYGTPLRLSLAAGGLVDLNGQRDDGLIAMAEPGQGGFQLSAGYFRMFRFGRGYSVRLAGIRTYEDPWRASAHATYLGAEAHVMALVGIGGRVGWFRRTGRTPDETPKDNLGTLGVSVGL